MCCTGVVLDWITAYNKQTNICLGAGKKVQCLPYNNQNLSMDFKYLCRAPQYVPTTWTQSPRSKQSLGVH